MTAAELRGTAAGADAGTLAVVCGGGSLPYAVAAVASAHGRRLMLFPLRGWADPERVAAFPHRWIALGQFGRFVRLARAEQCRDVVFIGTVLRPALTQIRLDLLTLRVLPRIVRAFRGGDDHLLTSIAGIFADYGFRLRGAQEFAPEILVPDGPIGRIAPAPRDLADIARGTALLDAISAYDVGQAVVVADNHVLAVEAAEGTDAMLARIADLRSKGRIHFPPGVGVLVKAPKRGQDRRFDLPSIGPQTVQGAAAAGLAGIAVAAGDTIAAEPERMREIADGAGIFVVGIAGGTSG